MGSVAAPLVRIQHRGAAVKPGDCSRPRRAAHATSPSAFSYITQPSTGAIPARSYRRNAPVSLAASTPSPTLCSPRSQKRPNASREERRADALLAPRATREERVDPAAAVRGAGADRAGGDLVSGANDTPERRVKALAPEVAPSTTTRSRAARTPSDPRTPPVARRGSHARHAPGQTGRRAARPATRVRAAARPARCAARGRCARRRSRATRAACGRRSRPQTRRFGFCVRRARPAASSSPVAISLPIPRPIASGWTYPSARQSSPRSRTAP